MPLQIQQGLPDWIRDALPPIATGTLLSLPTGQAIAGGTNYGPFLVSNYQTLVIHGFGVTEVGRGLQVTVLFYADAATTVQLSSVVYQTRTFATPDRILDAIPVMGPYVVLSVAPSIGLTLSSPTKVVASPLKFDGLDYIGAQPSQVLWQTNIAAGAVASAQFRGSPVGPYQIVVVCGNNYKAAGVPAIPWTLEVDALTFGGVANPIAVITNDAAVPANRQGRTDVVRLAGWTSLFSLRNDDVAARDFTVMATPMVRR